MKLKTLTLSSAFLLCGVLFAAEPIAIRHFGEAEGRVLGDIQRPENQGDLVFALNTVRTDTENLMYLSAENGLAVVQIVATGPELESRRFVVRLNAEAETLIDLGELTGYDALMMLSRDNFYATLGAGDQLRSLAADRLIYPGRNEAIEPPDAPIQEKSSCNLKSWFVSLTCATPVTCGSLSFTQYGELKTNCPVSGYSSLSWGCHSGFGSMSFPTSVNTLSSCGCYGSATWQVDFFGDVWYVTSRCPNDVNFSAYWVN